MYLALAYDPTEIKHFLKNASVQWTERVFSRIKMYAIKGKHEMLHHRRLKLEG
jgi:hypothetical protein